jgi:hypothetical protein
MNIRAEMDRRIERFCLWLGRYGSWSGFLDGISTLTCPAFVNPLLLPAAVGEFSPMSRPMFTSSVHGEPAVWNGNPGPAPSNSPNGGDPGDPPHSSKCAPVKYHGMHGAPCALNLLGTKDGTVCPFGTDSGLWWRFNIPGLGNVYYIDCCGRQINWTVWCRWAKEPNWCGGKGNNIYTCTLTILQGDLFVGGDGFSDPTHYVQSGPPGPGE